MRGKRSQATLSPPMFVVQIGRSNCFSNNRENSWLEALYCFRPWLGDVICTIWSQQSALQRLVCRITSSQSCRWYINAGGLTAVRLIKKNACPFFTATKLLAPLGSATVPKTQRANFMQGKWHWTSLNPGNNKGRSPFLWARWDLKCTGHNRAESLWLLLL